MRRLRTYYGVSADYVTAGNGSDELISVIVGTFLSKGDKLLTVMPDFSMYGFYADLAGVTVITQEKNEDLNIGSGCALYQDSQAGKADCIMFSNPCNPTGQGLSREEVRRLVTSVDCLVVLDEAYMDFYTESLMGEAEQYDNLIILRTCSKALGLAAVRLGFAVANQTLTAVIRAAKSPYNVNSSRRYTAVWCFPIKTRNRRRYRRFWHPGKNYMRRWFLCRKNIGVLIGFIRR